MVAALEFSKEDVPHYREIEGVAIGADIKPPLHFFQRKAVLGSVAERYGRPTLSLQLPEKPFEPVEFSNEHFIVSIRAPWEEPDEWSTFWTPYVQSLNRWYGLQIFSSGRAARAEIDGIGIVSPVTSENLTVASLKKIELATRLFGSAGSTQPKRPRPHCSQGNLSTRWTVRLSGTQNRRRSQTHQRVRAS